MFSAPASVTPSPLDAVLEAPFGKLGVCVANGTLREPAYLLGSMPTVDSLGALVARLARQLDAYYIDTHATFDTPFAPAGIDFQLRVRQATSAIPCGSTITYGIIAQQIGSVPRAVGQACGDNWFPILIPCHRVVSVSGIGGFSHYADGYPLNTKHWLLRHEGVMLI